MEKKAKAKIVSFEEMLKVNVNQFTEKKNNLTYLSWAHAWTEFKRQYPSANYEVVKDHSGKCYFEDENFGIMVFTQVTVENLTYEMWLPVMDGANKSMRVNAYNYQTRFGEKTCNGATMFDINKTIMRCLVKNLAMFGLGLYIYAGEDMPEIDSPAQKTKPNLKKVDFERAIETIKKGKYSAKELEEKFNLNATQQKTILTLKTDENGK